MSWKEPQLATNIFKKKIISWMLKILWNMGVFHLLARSKDKPFFLKNTSSNKTHCIPQSLVGPGGIFTFSFSG